MRHTDGQAEQRSKGQNERQATRQELRREQQRQAAEILTGYRLLWDHEDPEEAEDTGDATHHDERRPRGIETDYLTVEFWPLPNAQTCWIGPDGGYAIVNEDLSPVVQARVAEALIVFARVAAVQAGRG